MIRSLRSFAVLAILNGAVFGADAPSAARDRVRALRITVLSTMLADGDGLGEWGFAALVEADGHRILFDTGAHTDVVLKNARALKIDLTTVPDVILSHWHSDHVGGFMTLRESVRAKAPRALGRTHVGEGIFYPQTAGKLRGFGVDHVIGAHCTGIETVYRLRRDLALDRARAVVGAVGASFELGKGINAGTIAK